MNRLEGVTSQPNYTVITNKAEFDGQDEAVRVLNEQITKAAQEETVDEFNKENKEAAPKKKKHDPNAMLMTLLMAVIAGAGAMKFMPIARRLSAKVLGKVGSVGVKLAEKLATKFPKLKLSFNATKAQEKIAAIAKELKEGKSTKIVDWIKKNVAEVCGHDIKVKSPVLAGIKNDVGLIDAVGATTVGYVSMKKNSDGTEEAQNIDKSALLNAAGNILLIS